MKLVEVLKDAKKTAGCAATMATAAATAGLIDNGTAAAVVAVAGVVASGVVYVLDNEDKD